jgi:hypothetical protein
MNAQNFSNHVRVHPLYHYFAVPVSLLLVVAALVDIVIDFSFSKVIVLVATILLHLAIFLSREYAKKNQDRIIRMELRLRYFQLSRERLEEYEEKYSSGQLAAMRFASDDEFLQLLLNPGTLDKSPTEIKREIAQWQADWMRV